MTSFKNIWFQVLSILHNKYCFVGLRGQTNKLFSSQLFLNKKLCAILPHLSKKTKLI